MLRRFAPTSSRYYSIMSTDKLAAAQAFVNKVNEDYSKKHFEFEKQFWGTKMALKSTDETPYSTDLLSSTKKEMEDMLADPKILEDAKAHREAIGDDAPSDLVTTLDIIIKTCGCYTMPTAGAKAIREETSKVEGILEKNRNEMKLGYTDPADSSTFHEMSSVGLRNLLRTAPEESTRKAAYEGLRSIGPFVVENGFVEIVKLRNKLAHELGFVDYYDMTVTYAEGFGKDKLFEILDGLEEGTRPLMVEARKELAKRHGEDALEPWNMSFKMAGSVIKQMDPYFPFGKAVENYARSYAAMKIDYKGATMNLDLLDRRHKYSNGFCHWMVPAWRKPDGEWVPSSTNFTSLADPTSVGSGLTALTTLMHEAGHAAHFANIQQPSPLFSQERAPTSVAYAENQSMFLDSLVGDAAWRAKYAKNLDGESIPFDIIEEEIKSTHPFAVFGLRAMLSVSYFEKALYELPVSEVTAEKIQSLADEIENKIQGGLSPRPLLSVPHLVSDEASCYYQGYTLAEMSVHQTREHFKNKYGYIVDNPNVGPDITSSYWVHGNSRQFLDLVKDLTGKDLSGDAWIDALKESTADKIAREKKEYDEMIVKMKGEKEDSSLDLKMEVRFVDGDQLIATSSDGGLLEACSKFEEFVAKRVAAAATAAN